jgi:hypothetical protein
MKHTIKQLRDIESRMASFLESDGSRANAIGYDRARRENEQQAKAKYIRDDFRRKWARQLKISMSEFDFQCNDEEVMYITRPDDALYIHTAIGGALLGETCTTFIDAFAGVGGDTVAAINQFRNSNIFAIQLEMHTNTGRIDRLRNNVKVFQSILQRESSVDVIHNDIGIFLSQLVENQPVSVLYLDPPWALGADHSSYSPPAVINHFLTRRVWEPLQRKKIYPLLIVLKLPGNPTSPRIEEWPILGENIKYRQIGYLTPREKYAVYILRRVDATSMGAASHAQSSARRQ